MKFSAFKEIHNDQYHDGTDMFFLSLCVADFLRDKHRILLVGDCYARDFKVLSKLGKEIYVLDIAPQEKYKNYPKFYLQSITERTSFDDNFFDGVVMMDVIEHLLEDRAALLEVNRLLKPDGILVASVPYFNNKGQDLVEEHVRIHSKQTIRRLLSSSGFKIAKHVYRGFIVRLPRNRLIAYLLLFIPRKIVKILFGKRGLTLLYWVYCNIEYFFGRFAFIQRRFNDFGGYIKAEKSQMVDFYDVQVQKFRDDKPTQKNSKQVNV